MSSPSEISQPYIYICGCYIRVLKACAGWIAGVFQHLFNLSLKLKKVPQLWKTSCIVPVPEIAHHSSLKAQHLRPQLVCDSMDPLQFVYEAQLAMDDAIIYLLYRAYSRVRGWGTH